MNWSAVAPYQPPISSYSITSASSGSAALRDAVPGLRLDAVRGAQLVGLLTLAGDEPGAVRGAGSFAFSLPAALDDLAAAGVAVRHALAAHVALAPG
jgi:hypothetical protein